MSEGFLNLEITPPEAQIAEWHKVAGKVAKPSEVNAAIGMAINRALDSMRSHTAKGLRARYTVRSQAIKDAQHVFKATRNRLTGALIYTSVELPISAFKHKSNKIISWKGISNERRKGKQLQVEIIKGQATEYRGGFVQEIYPPNESVPFGLNVWRRKDTRAFPVLIQTGPSFPGMLRGSGVAQEALEVGNETLAKRIDHEMLRMLNK